MLTITSSSDAIKIQAFGLNFQRKMMLIELQKIKLTQDTKGKKKTGIDPTEVKGGVLSEENSQRRKKNCVFRLGERHNTPITQDSSPPSSSFFFTFSNSEVGRNSQNRGLDSEGTNRHGEET